MLFCDDVNILVFFPYRIEVQSDDCFHHDYANMDSIEAAATLQGLIIGNAAYIPHYSSNVGVMLSILHGDSYDSECIIHPAATTSSLQTQQLQQEATLYQFRDVAGHEDIHEMSSGLEVIPILSQEEMYESMSWTPEIDSERSTFDVSKRGCDEGTQATETTSLVSMESADGEQALGNPDPSVCLVPSEQLSPLIQEKGTDESSLMRNNVMNAQALAFNAFDIKAITTTNSAMICDVPFQCITTAASSSSHSIKMVHIPVIPFVHGRNVNQLNPTGQMVSTRRSSEATTQLVSVSVSTNKNVTSSLVDALDRIIDVLDSGIDPIDKFLTGGASSDGDSTEDENENVTVDSASATDFFFDDDATQDQTLFISRSEHEDGSYASSVPISIDDYSTKRDDLTNHPIEKILPSFKESSTDDGITSNAAVVEQATMMNSTMETLNSKNEDFLEATTYETTRASSSAGTSIASSGSIASSAARKFPAKLWADRFKLKNGSSNATYFRSLLPVRLANRNKQN
jgi:hypothetical protein